MNKISEPLKKVFERHRIVFWYDAKKELRSDFEAIELPGIEKIEIANNEFGIKHKILRELPTQKFLIYKEGSQPADIDNWLLDVQLAYGEFRTDQVAIWLSELGLGLEFSDVIQSHIDFFNAVKRIEALKESLKPDDTPGMIRMKMLAVCSNSGPRIDEVMENLLSELATGRDEKIRLIQRCNLDAFIWEQLKRCYGYESETYSVKDFAIELFKSCYAMETEGKVRLTSDALVFLKRWKDSIRHHKAFENLSSECEDILGIEQDLQKRDYRKLVSVDYFRLIDQKILSDLVKCVADRTISAGDCAVYVRQRRQTHWYKDFENLYEAIDYAAQFISALNEVSLNIDSMADGIRSYSNVWFKLDQLYRKFIFHVQKSGQPSLLERLVDQIENLYSNNFLLKVNDNWQQLVDTVEKWEAAPIKSQKSFFVNSVQPFLKKDNKVCVIISDALRYEIGEELLSLIRQEDRYEAKVEPLLSMLPSYTQLGMAALLPNDKILIAENDTGTVSIDGLSTQGVANRAKILGQLCSKKATAVRADELLKLNRDDCRAIIRENEVVYVYHNRIDSTGDKRDSEERVFEAVEETLDELIKLIKKLTAANVNNMLITADHGFIYQNRTIDESDFSGVEAKGDNVLFRDRRFVLGNGLVDQPSLRKFSAKNIGLEGGLEIQIPKSINRLRLKGSGSRYVHGGASLQEVVIPIIHVNKKRQSDIASVDVDILRGTSSVITSGQLAVAFYQTQPVVDKVQPRLLTAGIYNQEGELISDTHKLTFDLISENPRERELQVRFVLTRKADEVNGQEVSLRLEEQLPGTSHFREYKSVRYLMRRSFTSDFDF
jgi:uncharacterized protein (TIGR02687 family)